MELSSQVGLNILKCLGFELPNGNKEIDNSSEKSADFFVNYRGENKKLDILVEVKLKQYDSKANKEREEKLEQGKVHITPSSSRTTESINTIIRSANEQIRQSNINISSDFNILLFVAAGYDSDTYSEQLLNSLYGLANIINWDKKTVKKCYFYHYNEFIRRNSIDCVIVAESKNLDIFNLEEIIRESLNIDNFNISLCINPFSEKLSLLKNEFLPKIKDSYVIKNPNDEIESGEVYCLDKEDWNQFGAEQKAFCEKYKKNLNFIIKYMPNRLPINAYLSKKYKENLMSISWENPKFTIRRQG